MSKKRKRLAVSCVTPCDPFNIPPTCVLTDEQQTAVKRALETRDNLFMTGEAGTGKTLLIKYLIMGLCSGPHKRNFEVTAMTGHATQAIHGRTLQNWLGCGLFKDNPMYLAGRILAFDSLKQRWTRIQTLIIDEISMLKPDLLIRIDQVAKLVRKSPQPFGGIQLLVFGDFLQLPPVYTELEPMVDNLKYAFQVTHLFPPASHTYVFKKIFRQTDPIWQDILSHARKGRLTPQHFEILNTRLIDPVKDGIQPTQLMSKREDVRRENREKLQLLEPNQRKWMIYHAVTVPVVEEPTMKKMAIDLIKIYQKGRTSPEKLQLAIGAQVLLTKNIDARAGFTNSLAGQVVDFKKDPHSEAKYPEVLFINGEKRLILPDVTEIQYKNVVYAKDIQVPLQLGWALTIHRAQGSEFERIILALDSKIEGQGYVGMSRVKRLEGLHLTELNEEAIRADSIAVEYYDRLDSKDEEKKAGVKPTPIECIDIQKEKQDTIEKGFEPNILKGNLREILKQAEAIYQERHQTT